METRKADNYNIDIQDVSIIETDNSYLILLKKEIGSWVAIDKSKQKIIQYLKDGNATYREYVKLYIDKISLLEELFKKGILRVNGQSIIKDNYFEDCFYDIYPSLIVLNYTRNCNLSCSYCYAAAPNMSKSLNMSNEIVLSIIEKIKNTYGDKNYTICFHGGEPTLRYKYMVSLIKKLRLISDKLTFIMQTNATLITHDIAVFLKNEFFLVGISIDGCDEESNSMRCDKNGENSFSKTIIGLKNLLNVGITPTILTVITPSNQYKLLDIIKFFNTKGVKYFAFNTMIFAGSAEYSKDQVNVKELVVTMLRIVRYINSFNEKLKDKFDYIGERSISNLINHLTSWNRNHMCALSPCGSGRMMLAFDYDGALFPCDDFINDNKFSYGNILEIKDLKKTLENSKISCMITNHNVNNIKSCNFCNWKRICTYHCASDSYFRLNKMNEPHSMCSYIKLIVPQLIDMIYTEEINPKNFVSV